MSDLMVVHPCQHTILRALAAFVVAPFLIYAGIKYDDKILLIIGILTFIIDSYTYSKSSEKCKVI